MEVDYPIDGPNRKYTSTTEFDIADEEPLSSHHAVHTDSIVSGGDFVGRERLAGPYGSMQLDWQLGG